MSILPQKIGNIYDAALNRTFCANEVHEMVRERARQLFSLGLRRGHKAILKHGNSIYFYVDLFACWQLGACAIPLDADTAPPELARLVRFTEAILVLYNDLGDGADIPEFEIQNHACQVLHTRHFAQRIEVPFDIESLMAQQEFSLDDDALILFTSGSTSEPKGVVHSFRTLLAKMAICRKSMPAEDWTNTLCIIPTHFVYGLVSNSLGPLFQGCHLFIYPPFSLSILSEVSEIVERHSITAFCSVPSMWKIIFDYARPLEKKSLRRIHCAAAPLSKDLWRQIKSWSKSAEIKNVYGATEMACAITGPADGREFHDGLIGCGWDTRLEVRNEFGQIAAVGEVGEIYLQGPSMMKGYYLRPHETAAVLHQGWYRTGDLGVCDAAGDVTLVGRSKYVINKAGMKIYPEDVEAALMTNADILDACAFAWSDEIAGEVVAAAVVFKSEASSKSVQELESWTRTVMTPFKVPSKWFVLDAMPRTSRGKLSRTKLVEILKA